MAHELDSLWLYVHPPLAFTGYVLIFLFTILLLADRRKLGARFRVEFFGAAAWLFTFLGLLTGMLWAQTAWGTYWSWDPKETWSLITWFIYAVFLHARYTREWRGKRTAALSIIGFAAVVFTYFGVNYILSGLHSYA